MSGTALRAGPLHMRYDNGDLRHVTLNGSIVLLRVYVAARDRVWGTASATRSDVSMDIGADRFAIRYICRNQLKDIDFVWQALLQGDPDGTLRFSMDGVAQRTFQRARLGFCVLHPMRLAGAPARITHIDGSVSTLPFPRRIAPQAVIDGVIKPVPGFEEMRAIAHQAAPGMWAEVAFTGDTFETEDQRNWTDASYKTYCTPFRLPWPVEVPAGARITQSVTLRLNGVPPQQRAAKPDAPVRLRGGGPMQTLPKIGLALGAHSLPMRTPEIARLRALKPAHVRGDISLWEPDWVDELRRHVREARAIGAMLELGVYVDQNAPAQLDALGAWRRGHAPAPCRVLLFNQYAQATPLHDIARARAALGPKVALYAGSNLYFTELNRNRPTAAAARMLSGLVHGSNPQVHAFDDGSVMECMAALRATLSSYTRIARGLPLALSPLTLKPRFAVNDTRREPPEHAQDSDPRGRALFGAAWTTGVLKYVCESGRAGSVTLLEASGPRGVQQDGRVFPLYHVLADIAEFGGQAQRCISSDPLRADALLLRAGPRARWLLANTCDSPQDIRLTGLSARVLIKTLDENTVNAATRAPESWRAQPAQPVDTRKGALTLTLPAYAVTRLDYTE